MKFITNKNIYFLFAIISFCFLVISQGVENISFTNIEWVHSIEKFNRDPSLYQTAWYFFLNDVWRFPLGSNPNYGDGLGSSIVLSDAIPILALFFKSFKFIIPENFQYWTFWYYICFYFQLFFSFKIIEKFTGSISYSFIASLFFLFAPIFLYRLQWHHTLAGQWILLFALYIGLTQNVFKAKWLWLFIILLSSLISVYWMIIIIVVYSVLRIFNLSFNKESIFQIVKDFFIFIIPLLITLYVVGYFEIRLVDTLGMGFGTHKMNLLSIFDSTALSKINWSLFIPDIKLSYGEEIEGFNYLGLGQILMMALAFILFLSKRNKINLYNIKTNKEIKILLIASIFLTLWSLTNKVGLGENTLFEIPLNKYLFGALSILKGTGRIFYIVNYFLVILSIIVIFKCFSKKNSLLIIFSFFIIQMIDTSAGIKHRINFLTPIKTEIPLKDRLWGELFQDYKILKTTYPINYTHLFWDFSYFMEKYKIEKTNIVALARTRRKAAAELRYQTYENFRKKKLKSNSVYIVDGLGHLRNLKYLFKDENVGFFYRDNHWAMVNNEKNRMNSSDNFEFNNIKPKLLEINQEKKLNFSDDDTYYGFGWSHNFKKQGIWSEGQMSTLLFTTEKNDQDLMLEILYEPYITKKNKIFEFDIYINNLLSKEMIIKENKPNKLEIIIKKNSIKNNEVKIDFNLKNPISPYEVLESPDGRKLGILVKTIKLTSI